MNDLVPSESSQPPERRTSARASQLIIGHYRIALTPKVRWALSLGAILVLSQPASWFVSEFTQARGITSLVYSRLILVGLGICVTAMIFVIFTNICTRRLAAFWSFLIALVSMIGLDRIAPPQPSAPKLRAPSPPTGLVLEYTQPVPLADLVPHFSKSLPTGPCYGGAWKPLRSNGFVASSVPSFLPDLKQIVIRTTSAEPANVWLLIEAEIVNRGARSIARGWRLCLEDGKRPRRILASEILPDRDLRHTTNKAILDAVAARAPLETGTSVSGWIKFQAPKAIVDAKLIGVLTFTDYLGNGYGIGFGPTK